MRERYRLDAEVWALCWDGDYAQEFVSAGVPIRVLGFRRPMPHCDTCGIVSPRPILMLRWTRRLLNLAWEFRRAGVDVLMPFTAWPNIVAGLTYRLGGVKACIWGERHAGGERMPVAERFAVRQYRRFVANSTAGVEFLANEMRVPREKISFVPNGVEEPAPASSGRRDWRAHLGLTPSQPLVVKVANISGFKDHESLLHAWKIVQDRWPNEDRPYLALAGSYDDKYNDCRRLARETTLDTTVGFLGSVKDVSALIRASDLTVFSSRNEGMPNGVLECMALGKAIVASDLPGIRDALGPGCDDSLVEPGDVYGFANKILALLNDEPARQAMGERYHARIKSEFSVQRMAERQLQIALATLSRSHPAASALMSAPREA
jgi:glycosyltransferase involved in cell wall biosynthesis